MPFQDKIMFEIYRDQTYSNEVRVVYFTELNEHNKGFEIDRAMLGEHIFDGFFPVLKKERAINNINNLVSRLNEGELIDPQAMQEELAEFLVS